MTETTNGRRRSWRWISSLTSSPDVAESKPAPAQVVVHLPQGASAAACASVQNRLGELLESRRIALAIERPVVVTVHPLADDAVVTVTIDDRVAAICAAGRPDRSEAAWAASVVGRLDRILRHRCSLLLGEDQRRARALDVARRCRDVSRIEWYQGVPGTLLDAGISLARLEDLDFTPAARAQPSAAAVAEVVLDQTAAATIDLRVPVSVLRAAGSDDDHRVAAMRARLYDELGIEVPDIELTPTQGATMRLWLNDLVIETELAPDAAWAQVVQELHERLSEHAHWFVGPSYVGELRARLEDVMPSLVEISRTAYSDAVISSCLRTLLRGGENVRNLPRLLWLLCDQDSDAGLGPSLAPFDADDLEARTHPEFLASRVRARWSEDSWRAGARPALTDAVVVSDDLVARLAHPQLRAAAEGRLASEYRRLEYAPVVAAPTVESIAAVRFALAAAVNRPTVVTLYELPLDTNLTVTLG